MPDSAHSINIYRFISNSTPPSILSPAPLSLTQVCRAAVLFPPHPSLALSLSPSGIPFVGPCSVQGARSTLSFRLRPTWSGYWYAWQNSHAEFDVNTFHTRGSYTNPIHTNVSLTLSVPWTWWVLNQRCNGEAHRSVRKGRSKPQYPSRRLLFQHTKARCGTAHLQPQQSQGDCMLDSNLDPETCFKKRKERPMDNKIWWVCREVGTQACSW